MYWTCTSVLGCFFWNSTFTPSRNFVCSGLPSPICQTTILAGSWPFLAAVSDFLPPQPVTATASTTAAAAALVYLTLHSLRSPRGCVQPLLLVLMRHVVRTARGAPAYSRGCGSADSGLWGHGRF